MRVSRSSKFIGLCLSALSALVGHAHASEPIEPIALAGEMRRQQPDGASPPGSPASAAPLSGRQVTLLAQSLGGKPDTEKAGESTLTRDEVLAKSLEHMPRILEAMARYRAAEGDAVSAMGAFDLMLRSEGFAWASGFWSGRVVEAEAEQAIAPFGAKIYGRYRVSDGRFPIYQDINFTNQLGEAKIGAMLSLLRDRAIDERRGAIRESRIAVELAEIELMLTRLGIQHQALGAYYDWIAAGARRDIFAGLLEIAEERQRGLARRVERGDVADILLVENRQNLARRTTLLVQAERDVRNAALALSQFYRNSAGEPTTPEDDELPAQFPAVDPRLVAGVEGDIARARTLRPELAEIDARLEQARLELELGENQYKPELTLSTELSRDFGDVGAGGISRDSTDTVISFRFSLPLQRRFAQGRIQRSRAEMDALTYRRQLTEERIEMEIRRLVVDLRAAAETVGLAEQEVSQAEAMERAERRRFEAGGSDFFVVNRREEAAADARIRLVAAQRQFYQALANYRAATADLRALGIVAGIRP